ncbi:MAG: hypothetical protein ACUVQ8_02160 [Nitrososphaeria archaeon]
MMLEKTEEPRGQIIERYNVGDVEITIIELEKEAHYLVREPEIEQQELEKSETIIESFYSKKNISHSSAEKILDRELKELSRSARYYVSKKISPYGKLYPLVLDQNVLEVSIISSEKPVFIRHKHFLEQPFISTNLRFESRKEMEECLEKFKIRMASYSTVNPCEGLVDENFHGQVIIQRHPYESICFLKRRLTLPSTPTWLIEDKTLSPQEKAYLWTLIETKTTIAIVGASRESRRLLLSGMVSMIPQKAKIMTIEKTPISNQIHEYFIRIFVNKEVGLSYEKALEIVQRQDIEYTIMDAEDVETEIRLPANKTCFIYSRQTPLEICGGAQVSVTLPYDFRQGGLEYLEEIEGEQTHIILNPSDNSKQVFEKSRILQAWAKTNHYSKEKVIESITLKSNLVAYINGIKL